MALTKRCIDALRFNPERRGKQIIWDGDLSGFGLRVFESGVKTFVLNYHVGGGNGRRTRLLTLGRYGVLTVDQARKKAIAELAKVNAGADPVEERREKRNLKTLKAVCEAYVEHNRGRLKPKTIATYQRLIRPKSKAARRRLRHMTRLGARPVKDITVRDVSRLHYYLRATPMAANRTIDHLSAVLHWAESMGYREPNSNPCTAVRRHPEKSRERFLTIAETAALGEALNRALTEGLEPAPQHRAKPGDPAKQKHRPKNIAPIPANPYAVAVIRFLLLSGWRKGEAQTLKWADIDFERRTATLQDSKTGKSYRPLGAPALQLLAELPQVDGNLHVFAHSVLIGSATDGSQQWKPAPGGHPVRDIKRVWGAVRHAAGLDDVRLHDLRHTVASFSVAGGHSLYLTGSLLGHKQPRTTARYAHVSIDARHAVADEVSGRIAAALNGTKQKGNVVELHAKNVS
jgi:integrase